MVVISWSDFPGLSFIWYKYLKHGLTMWHILTLNKKDFGYIGATKI